MKSVYATNVADIASERQIHRYDVSYSTECIFV